jgi:hypothetical protein
MERRYLVLVLSDYDLVLRISVHARAHAAAYFSSIDTLGGGEGPSTTLHLARSLAFDGQTNMACLLPSSITFQEAGASFSFCFVFQQTRMAWILLFFSFFFSHLFL